MSTVVHLNNNKHILILLSVCHHLFISPTVILAPYGLAGVITGHTYRESDPNTQRLLDDWRQLYVLRDADLDGCSRMPPAVEVVVGTLQPIAVMFLKFKENAQMNKTPSACAKF